MGRPQAMRRELRRIVTSALGFLCPRVFHFNFDVVHGVVFICDLTKKTPWMLTMAIAIAFRERAENVSRVFELFTASDRTDIVTPMFVREPDKDLKGKGFLSSMKGRRRVYIPFCL